MKYAWHRTGMGAYATRMGDHHLEVWRADGAWHGRVNGRQVTGYGFPVKAQAQRVCEALAFGNAHGKGVAA